MAEASPPGARPPGVGARPPAVVVKNLCKSYGEKRVLDDVSLTIDQGSITVLLGPSGTGKSVLMRSIVGLTRPESGEVLVFGEDIAALDPDRPKDRENLFRIRRRFGMLFQDGALFDDMSVGDNVAFPMRVHSDLSEAEIQAKVADKLARVGLPDVQRMYPSELSGGMRKRVAFARAIALEPDIVLCDEPSSGLDPVMSATLDELILELHKTLGMTFIIISHDTAQARILADTLGLLAGGRLVTYGPAERVFREDHPALHQFFARATEGPIKVV